MKFHCADDAVIRGRHLNSQVTFPIKGLDASRSQTPNDTILKDGHQPELPQFCGEYPCTIWKRYCMVHGCSNRKTVRTDHEAMLLTDT